MQGRRSRERVAGPVQRKADWKGEERHLFDFPIVLKHVQEYRKM